MLDFISPLFDLSYTDVHLGTREFRFSLLLLRFVFRRLHRATRLLLVLLF